MTPLDCGFSRIWTKLQILGTCIWTMGLFIRRSGSLLQNYHDSYNSTLPYPVDPHLTVVVDLTKAYATR